MCRFLFDTQCLSVGIKFNHTVALRITHTICKHLGTLCQAGCLLQAGCQPMTIENIIPENQAGRLPVKKAAANQEGLGKSTRGGLLGILNIQPQLATIPQQLPEVRQILRC